MTDRRQAVRPEIAEALTEAIKAGVFRRAARLNPKQAEVWHGIAEHHSALAKQLLEPSR